MLSRMGFVDYASLPVQRPAQPSPSTSSARGPELLVLSLQPFRIALGSQPDEVLKNVDIAGLLPNERDRRCEGREQESDRLEGDPNPDDVRRPAVCRAHTSPPVLGRRFLRVSAPPFPPARRRDDSLELGDENLPPFQKLYFERLES